MVTLKPWMLYSGRIVYSTICNPVEVLAHEMVANVFLLQLLDWITIYSKVCDSQITSTKT